MSHSLYMSLLSNLNSLLHSFSLSESKSNDMVSQDFLIDLSRMKVNIRHHQSSDLREPKE